MTQKSKGPARELEATQEGSHSIAGPAVRQVPDCLISDAGTAFDARLLAQVTMAGAGHLPADESWHAASASAGALVAMAPRTPGEAILASLIMAVSDATMDCLQRANALGQPEQVRAMNLNFAFKGASLVPQILDAFEKRRTGSNPAIRVEQVNVHAGGQAIVGHVQASSENTLPPSSAHPDLPEGQLPPLDPVLPASARQASGRKGRESKQVRSAESATR